eukprot:gnl/TRDRNA2_/TRDRNA2_154444_c0_seq1.p1 gnl/TRDRNA2_/TRDRNA2_154444_c0~~gnl/TRDRNA2_/TRDRNA2_154444_c0_seq1.p1  ORF type:complete len:698 (-),score=151.83 gnl/TRDRNA2_/TRDRNA2_154444_c0_seq1:91-2184(-)
MAARPTVNFQRAQSFAVDPLDANANRRSMAPEPGKGGVASVESAARDAADAMARVEQYEIKKARMDVQESEEEILYMIRSGQITEVEARQLRARREMHKKEEANAVDATTMAAAGYQGTEQMLEEVLDTESKIFIIRLMKKLLGINKLNKAINKKKRDRDSPAFRHPYPRLKKLISSNYFEGFLGLLMTTNGILIGIQVSYSDPKDREPYLFYMEHFFTIAFVLEIIGRIMVDSWIWLFRFFNAADFLLIVFTGCLPMWILEPLGIDSPVVRALQVLRVLRLIRLVRMVRSLPAFKTLWYLIGGCLDSGRTLLWTYILILSVLYILAVFGVYLIGKAPVYEDEPIAFTYFGDVPKALFTLFQTATLDQWSMIARGLMKENYMMCLYFIACIGVVTLGLLNLVIAVIVENAFKAKKNDIDIEARRKRDQMEKDIKELKALFVQIDADGSGILDKDEYDDAVKNNQKVKEKFDFLQISQDEADEIWNLLENGRGELRVEEFANGLRGMKGEAKAKDSFSVVQRLAHLNTRVARLSDKLRVQQDQVNLLRKDLSNCHKQMGQLMIEVRDFMAYITRCIPSANAPRPAAEFRKLEERLAAKKAAAQELQNKMKMERAQQRGRRGARIGPDGRPLSARSRVSRGSMESGFTTFTRATKVTIQTPGDKAVFAPGGNQIEKRSQLGSQNGSQQSPPTPALKITQ